MPPADEAPTHLGPQSAPRDDGFDFNLNEEIPPAPPRRRRLPLLTAALTVCAAIGLGVVFGILIQKHWGSTGGGSGRAANATAAFAGRTGQAGGQTGGAAGRAGGFTRSGTAGQVKAIDGTSLYVTDLQGNTVKVTTAPGVQVHVTSTGTLKKIHPGDYVTVQGTQTTDGYQASSITDSGTESPFAGGFGGGFGGGSDLGGSGSGFGDNGSSGGSTGSSGTGSGGGTNGSGAGNAPALPGLGG